MMDRETEPGAVFEGPRRLLSAARIRAFSSGPLGTPGWPERNPHTDASLASAAGFSGPVASGFQAEGDIVRLMVSLFGPSWTTHGMLRVKFIAPAVADESVRAVARLRAKNTRDGAMRFEFDVWCEKQNGDKIIVGEATGRLL